MKAFLNITIQKSTFCQSSHIYWDKTTLQHPRKRQNKAPKTGTRLQKYHTDLHKYPGVKPPVTPKA